MTGEPAQPALPGPPPLATLPERRRDYGSQILIWLATSAVFPAAVFYGFVLAGDSKESQIGRGQLLLVASALTAPIIGSLISMPGKRNLPRSILFFAAFVHVSVTVFYFAAAADGTPERNANHVATNSIWLYLFAVAIGVSSVVMSARAIDEEIDRRVANATQSGDTP